MQYRRMSRLRRLARTGVSLAIGAALAFALRPLPTIHAQVGTTSTLDAEEAQFLNLLNAYRQQNNLPALTVSNTLNYAADVWSMTLAANPSLGAQHFAQTASGLSTPQTRMLAAGYPAAAGAENVAAGTCCDALQSAQEAFNGWKNSPGHNANMLGSGWKAIGIARVRASTGGWFWTTDFGSVVDNGAPPATPPTALILSNGTNGQAVASTPQYVNSTNPYQQQNPLLAGTQGNPYGPTTATQLPYGTGVTPFGAQTNPYITVNPYGGVPSYPGATGLPPAGTGIPSVTGGYPGLPTQGGMIVPGAGGYDPSQGGMMVPGPGGFDPSQGGMFPGMGGPMPYGPGGPGSVPNTNPYANPTVNQGQPMQLQPGGNTPTPSTIAATGAQPTPNTLQQPAAVTPNPAIPNPTTPAALTPSAVSTTTPNPVASAGASGRPTTPLTALSDASAAFVAGSKAASYNAPVTPAGTIFGPLVTGNKDGWNSVLTVQNPSTNAANYTITVWDGQGKAQATYSATTNPNATTTFNLGSQLPAGFVGSITVDGTTPIVAVLNGDRAGSNGYAFPLIAKGDQALYAPLVFGNYNGWTSNIAVQNLDAQPARVTLAYTASATGAVNSEAEVEIAPFSTRLFNLGASSAVAAGFSGSAVIRATNGKSLAAVVTAQHSSGTSQSYVALTGGAPNVATPLLFKNRNGWNTGIQVQNIGTMPANVTVSYASSTGGAAGAENAVVQPGQAATFYQPSNTTLPDGFVGSATITSDGPPLAVLVNGVNYGRGLATTYTSGADTAGATRIYAPLLFKGASGLNTGVQVQASGNQAASVTVTYYDANGQTVTSQQESIPAGQSRTFYQPGVTGLPDGFRGSAVVTSSGGQPISAIINQVRY